MVEHGICIHFQYLITFVSLTQVAKLFENQEDLLQEFSQFLPDATNNSATQAAVSDIMDQYRTHHGVRIYFLFVFFPPYLLFYMFW